MSVVDTLTQKILAQNTVSQWNGEGFGSPQNNARAMAEILANNGITRLEDFGKVPTYKPVEPVAWSLNGQTVYDNPGNGYYVSVPTMGYDENGNYGMQYSNRYLSADETRRIQPTQYGIRVFDYESGSDNIIPVPTNGIQNINGVPSYKDSEVWGNKATGKAIPANYDRAGGDIWGGTFAGKDSTSFGVSMNEMGMPIFFTQYGGSTSDWGQISQVLSFASMIPGIGPFAAALNAVGNAYNGNTTGAILSALSAAGGFGAEYGTIDPASANYINQMDAASDAAAGITASAGTSLANFFAQNAGAIQTTQQAISVMDALNSGNLGGIVNSLVKLAPQIGVTIPQDFMKPIQVAAITSSISKGDWTSALASAGTLTGNSDFNTASKAVKIVDAVNNLQKTGNPASVFGAFVDFAKTTGLTKNDFDRVLKNSGYTNVSGVNIWDSADPTATFENSVKAEIADGYNDYLGRPASQAEINNWYLSGGDLENTLSSIQNSPEAAEYFDKTNVSVEEAQAAAAAEGYTLTAADLAKYTGKKDEASTIQALKTYADPLSVTLEEAKAVAAAEGYTLTAANIASYTGQKNEASTLRSLKSYADPRAVTLEEAQAAAAAEGYTLTAADIARYTGQKNETSTIKALKTYADPLGTTEEEATKFFQDKYGRDPRPEEIAKLVGMSEALSTKAVDTSYTNEVKKYDTEFGDYQGAIDKAAALKDKISFADAFSGARNLAALNGEDPKTATFSWTDPKTGVTGVYKANTADEIKAQLAADQKRIDLMPVYGGSENTRTGKPVGKETVYINTKTGDVVNDDRVFDALGNVVSGSIGLANNDTKVAALQTAVGSGIRTALDVGAGLIKGVAGVIEGAGTFAGLLGADMDNILRSTGKSVQESVQGFRSNEFKSNQKLMNDSIAKAGNEGFWSQAMETLIQFGANPTQAAAFIAEQGVSLLVGGGAMTAARALGAGMAVAEAASLTASAVLQGASVAGETYDDLKKQGATEDEAKNAARASGTLAGFVSAVANKYIPGAMSGDKMIAAQTAASTALKTALKGEMTSELAEETAGKVIQNIATGKSWDADLGATAVQALIGSGVTTGLVHTAYSALDPVQSTPPSKFEGVTAQEIDGAMKGFSSKGYTPSRTELADIINRNPSASPADIEFSATKYADTHNDVADQLTAFGVPASKVSDLASQITMETTFGSGGLEGANNILGILENNGIDTKAATAMASNISGIMTADQVQQVITDTIKANPSMTAAQIQGIVDSAVKDFATTNDIKNAIAGIQFPAGLSKTDVTDAIKGYMKDNPGITLDQVAGKVADATKGLATTTGVTTAISDALKGYATANDIKAAIAGIQFPAGLTPADVTTAIKNYMTANPGITLDQVAGKVADATKGLATSTGVTTAISDALKGYATTKDIQAAIAGIQFPVGITPADVTKSITDYMKANPGLSLADVSSKITDATKNLATNAGVTTAIGDALKGYATTKDIQNAIAGIKFPAGLTPADVTKSITDYMKANPGLTLDQVASKITDATKGLATTVGVNTAISDALKTQTATQTAQIADLKTTLSAAIADAKAFGLSGDAALKSAIDVVAANQNTSSANLLSKLGATEASLKTDFALQISGLDTKLSAAIASAKATGLSGDAALQVAIDKVAADQKTTSANLLSQLGTSTASLKTQFSEQIGGLDTKLSAAIADAKAFGLSGDAALKSAIDVVAASQKTNAADLLSKLGTTESNLKTQFATQISGLDTKLSDAINQAKASGLAGDAALQAAINKVASDQGTSAANMLNQLGITQTTLQNQFSTQINGLDSKLTAAIADAKASGLAGDAALQSAINKVAADQSTNASTLLTKLGATETSLKNQFGTQISGVDTKLSAAIADAKASGLAGDQALQAAINKVAADQGLSATKLLAQLGTTEANLKSQFGTQISGLDTKLSAAIADAVATGLSGDAALKVAIDKVAASQNTTADNLLKQIGVTQATLQNQFGVQISGLDSKLSAAIADAKSAGLSGDAVLQSAINAVAADQKTSASSLLAKLNTTESNLKSDYAMQINGLDKTLSAAIADAKATGLSGDAALQKAIDKVAADQGVSATNLLAQLGTSTTNLKNQFSSQITGLDDKLSAAIADAKASGLSGDAALQKAIDKVAADQNTSAANLLSNLGTTEANLKSQFATQISGLDTKLSTALAAAQAAGLKGDAALQSAIDKVAADQNTSRTDLLARIGATESTVLSQMKTGMEKTQADIASTKQALQTAIQDAQKAGQQGDAALQAGIDSVAANLGLTREAFLSKLGATEASLRTDMAAGLSGVQASIADTKTALESAISAARAAGLSGDQALQSAISKVAADQQTNSADLLAKLGTTEAGLKTEFASGLAGVQANISNVQKSLQDAMAENEAAGLSRDQAAAKAINDVAASVGTTKEALLAQMGVNEASLRSDLASGLAGVSQNVADVEARIEAAMKANQQAGMDANAALNKAINDVSGSLNTSRADLLARLGETEQSLQQQLSTGLTDVEQKLNAAMAANEAVGMGRDQALNKAVEDVAASVGSTRTALLAQMGETEQSLRSQFNLGQQQTAEQITGLSQQMQAQYNAMSDAQKAEVAARIQQGQDTTTAINGVQQALTGQIQNLSQQTQQQFAGMSAAQQAEVQARVAQGETLQNAISSVATTLGGQITQVQQDLMAQLGDQGKQLLQSLQQQGMDFGAALQQAVAAQQQQYEAGQQQTTEQIANVQSQLTSAMQANEAAGLSRDEAAAKAIQDVATSLNTTKEAMLSQIGKTEASLQQQLTSGLAGVTQDFQQKYEALSAAQKAQFDAMVEQGQSINTAMQAVQAGLQQQIGELGQTQSQQYQQLSQGQKDLYGQMVAQGVSQSDALSAAVANLSQSQAQQFGQLSQGQKDLFNQMVAQGASQADALNSAISGVQGQISDVQRNLQQQLAQQSADVQQQYASMTAAQQAEVQARLAQGNSLQAAIAASQQQTSGQISELAAQTQSQYQALTAAQKAQVDAMMQQGQDLRTALSQVQSGLQQQVTDVESRISAAMAANEAAGMDRNQALTKAIDDVAASAGQTKVDLLAQLGRTEADLRQDIAVSQAQTQSQIAGLSAQAQAQYAAMTAAQQAEVQARVAQGETLQNAINASQQAMQQQLQANQQQSLAQYNALSAAQQAEVQARIQQGQSLQDAISAAQQTTAGQIGALSQQTQQQYAALTAAQKAETDARVAQGQSLQEAIAAAQQATAGQIGNLQQSTTEQFNALTAAQKAEVDARVQQGQSLQEAIAAAQQATAGQISGLEQSTNAQFNALTAAQKAEVDARVQQGQTLQEAITAAQQATSGQIAGLQQSTNAQFNSMSAAQQAEVQARIQQGQTLQDAITATQRQAAQQAEQQSLQAQQNQAQTVQMFNSLDANQKAEVDARVQQGVDLRTAIESVRTDTNTNQAATDAQFQAIRAAQAAAAAKAEEDKLAAAAQAAAEKKAADEKAAAEKAAAETKAAAEKAAAARQAQTQSGLSVLQNAAPGGSGTGFGAAAAAMSPLVASFLTSKEGKDRFQDPLEAYRRLQSQPLAGENQYGLPTASEQTSQQPQQDAMNTPFYSYGQDSSIDDILGMPTSTGTYGYKAGGLATPMFAQGGTTGTRHGKYASGGMPSPLVAAGGKMRVDFRHGDAVTGEGDGQSDDIPAMLADGEFVFPADVVAAIGNGSTKAGSDKLYDMMHGIRAHVRSAKPEDLPPEIKSPLAFLKSKKARK